jgi:hypothetical protein
MTKRIRAAAAASGGARLLDAAVDPNKISLPSQSDIATLAYSYWEARGCQGGSPEDDWFRAERELMAHLGGYNNR